MGAQTQAQAQGAQAQMQIQGTQGTQEAQAQTQAQTQTQEAQGSDGEKKYSDADLDAILGKKFAKWQEKQDVAVKEAERLASMSAQQKAEYQTQKLQEKLDALLKESARNKMQDTARSMLAEQGITVDTALLSMLVTDSAESTNAAVGAFAELLKTEIAKGVKEALKGKTPASGTQQGGNLTKEQIMQIKDPAERQQMILANKDLFGI